MFDIHPYLPYHHIQTSFFPTRQSHAQGYLMDIDANKSTRPAITISWIPAEIMTIIANNKKDGGLVLGAVPEAVRMLKLLHREKVLGMQKAELLRVNGFTIADLIAFYEDDRQPGEPLISELFQALAEFDETKEGYAVTHSSMREKYPLRKLLVD